MGGKNSFLGITYIVIGAVCFLVGLLFAVVHGLKPRRMGDPKYLSWNNNNNTGRNAPSNPAQKQHQQQHQEEQQHQEDQHQQEERREEQPQRRYQGDGNGLPGYSDEPAHATGRDI